MDQHLTPPTARRPRADADYRWTMPKALAFLEALARCGKVAEAARAVGMSRQSAYRLRARLAGGPLGEGFELARRAGVAARAARPRSRWEGPGLDTLTGPSKGDASGRQGDTHAGQGDAMCGKVTLSALNRVTNVNPSLWPPRDSPAARTYRRRPVTARERNCE